LFSQESIVSGSGGRVFEDSFGVINKIHFDFPFFDFFFRKALGPKGVGVVFSGELAVSGFKLLIKFSPPS
jgi:hypothetical protein